MCLSDTVLLGTDDEKVEKVMTAEETAPAHSIDYSCDFQRMKGVFQPRRKMTSLAALARRCDARHYCTYQAESIPYCENTVAELRIDCAREHWEG